MTGARALLDRAAGALLAVLMGVAVLNVTWQVMSRFALGAPSSFTDELARYLLVWIGLVGAAVAMGRRLHVAVDLVPRRLDRRFAAPLALVAHGAVALFALVVMILGGARLVALSFQLGQTTAALGVSLGWVYAVLPASGTLVLLYALIALVEDWQALPGTPRS
ncbi:MAG: TRAP transporter small permease [Myxococcota bacterium]|nr:TRAP transporter small permease [Myxococcota bacterium]